jgi:Transcriptional accessory protein
LGEKVFEQVVGFLRIMNGDNLLDVSSVYLEAYPVVNVILDDIG